MRSLPLVLMALMLPSGLALACPPPMQAPPTPPAPEPPQEYGESSEAYRARLTLIADSRLALEVALRPVFPQRQNEGESEWNERLRLITRNNASPKSAGESAVDYTARVTALARQIRVSADAAMERAEAENRARERARQESVLEAADLAFIVRIVHVKHLQDGFHGPLQRVTLLPVATIKGRAPNRRFSVRHSFDTSCGPVGGTIMADGKLGDQFVIYAPGDTYDPDANQLILTEEAVFDPRVAAAFGAARNR